MIELKALEEIAVNIQGMRTMKPEQQVRYVLETIEWYKKVPKELSDVIFDESTRNYLLKERWFMILAHCEPSREWDLIYAGVAKYCREKYGIKPKRD